MAKKTEKVEAAEQVQAPESEQVQAPEQPAEPEMVQVVVKTRFRDKACDGKLRRVGESLEITKERFDEIAAAGKVKGCVYVEVKADEAE